MKMTKMLHAESDQGKYSFTFGMIFFGDMVSVAWIASHRLSPFRFLTWNFLFFNDLFTFPVRLVKNLGK